MTQEPHPGFSPKPTPSDTDRAARSSSLYPRYIWVIPNTHTITHPRNLTCPIHPPYSTAPIYPYHLHTYTQIPDIRPDIKPSITQRVPIQPYRPWYSVNHVCQTCKVPNYENIMGPNMGADIASCIISF